MINWNLHKEEGISGEIYLLRLIFLAFIDFQGISRNFKFCMQYIYIVSTVLLSSSVLIYTKYKVEFEVCNTMLMDKTNNSNKTMYVFTGKVLN